MKNLIIVTRMLLGFIFLIAGVNGYFVLFHIDPFIETSPYALTMFPYQYFLVLEKTVEIISGLLLLLNRFIPLTLIVLSPIITNIFFLHLFVDHSLLPLAILLVILHSYLLYQYRQYFTPLFKKST
ncbi:hypothetical protein [Salirhabdus salicampi]|uniref:hypothetical protein n=1 Tax=Salirhabdus salicampi TaxID=476102 RepID=UPI0020C4CCDA|nr:hypothetical protein [Salirhabdus salicampi]MCP8615302.1 hypothetical protein [Salirhabdus salicampi]